MIVNKQNVECCQQNCMVIFRKAFWKDIKHCDLGNLCYSWTGKNVQPNECKKT